MCSHVVIGPRAIFFCKCLGLKKMFDRVLCFPREMYRTFEVVKTFQNSISGAFFLPDFAAIGSYTKW